MKVLAPSPAHENIQLARPLLSIPRAEIEEFARTERIRFREDASNQSVDILRNRIRHKLLPYLERDFQSGIRDVIRRTMDLISAESEYVYRAASDWLKHPRIDFSRLSNALQRRVVQLQLIQLGIPPDFDLIEWLREFPEKPCSAAAGQEVHRDRSGKVIVSTPACPEFSGPGVTLNLDEHVSAQLDGVHVSWKVRAAKIRELPRRPGLERFDADIIGGTVLLRHWQRGDRFQPIGMTNSVKLQDLFGNLKVPRAERHQRVLAVAENGEIFWVEGLRISEKFKLTPQTRRVLEWRWRR
jgi:tRNA(Ile)-lysidine synthase